MTQRSKTPDRLQVTIEHVFERPALLREALTHASAAGRAEPSYERLEFLGDRVLGLVVAETLFDRFPDEDEGALARRFAALVRREALAEVALMIGLGEFLILSSGEDDSGARANPAILADACEALIAALYRDGGMDAARVFIEHHWRPRMEADSEPPMDSKTAVQEWAQARGLALPVYALIAQEGPEHAPTFLIEARLSGQAPARGDGRSKRAAEQVAASVLLARLTDATEGAGEAGEIGVSRD
ncbi:MAG: ribonuclease III [Alphaproteobacteria bacterium]